MNTPARTLILSTDGFAHRADLATHAEAKAMKLSRHAHPHVGLVRLHVKRETPHAGAPYFSTRATAEAAGPDYVAHARSPEPITAINAAFDQLERAATKAARAWRTRKRAGSLLEAGAA
jgi:ribosome-associated translation inhibitor RaiA